MVKILLLGSTLAFVSPICFSQYQIVGRWKTLDDKTGEAKSIIEISEKNGEFFGQIVELLLEAGQKDPVCEKCDPSDPRHRKKIKGMEILRNLRKEGNEYNEGTILDPEIGKIYRCKAWLEQGDLKIRGYWGPFYRTQTWKKAS
jgi:uncharacterized protein (DUF2147 family)